MCVFFLERGLEFLNMLKSKFWLVIDSISFDSIELFLPKHVNWSNCLVTLLSQNVDLGEGGGFSVIRRVRRCKKLCRSLPPCVNAGTELNLHVS